MSFENYTDCVFRAFCSHPKPAEIVKRKQDIIAGVAAYHNFVPDSVLYIGFNPAILAETANMIAVTHISQAAQDFLHGQGIKFNTTQRNLGQCRCRCRR